MFGFRKTKKKIIVYSPFKGKVMSLDEVSDEAFSKRLIGDGLAVLPFSGKVFSPLDGILSIFPTKHALTFEKSGLELIVHIGIDTVKLKGEGFTVLRNEGKVKMGEAVLSFDLDNLEKNSLSALTPIIVSNMEAVEKLEILAMNTEVEAGSALFEVTLK